MRHLCGHPAAGAAGDETVTEYRVAVSGGIGADLYEAETVRRFTALTHDAYAEALGPEITRIPAMFTDEPAGAPDAVTEEILRIFAERCGCRLEDRLYVLSDRADLSPEETRLRLAYFRLLEELFARALRGMREACRAHGMLLTGHLDRDHLPDACYSLGYGNALAMLRILDVPGVDAILGQLLPEGSLLPEGMGFYPRMASSAAAQNGTRLALSESFGVYGNALSGDALRWLVSSQLVRGIDLFNAMLCPSTVEKWYAYGERQFFHPSFPGFNAMDGLWREIGRACLFMGTGDHAADTALFYPCADLLLDPARRSAAGERFCAAGDALEAAGIDFDVIDEEAILAGDLRDGALCCGTARYTKIVVPEGASLSPEAAEKLGALSGKCEPLVVGLPENVLHRAVRDNGGDLHVCVSNLRRETVEARICLRTDAPVYRADARTGAFTAFENGGAVALRPGETALFYATRRAV
ncbi:MAG: hypothetical protein IJL69_04105, partial [Oscillospiraceae bacterium]|nr:hypothetical protein [Oscillospiraceae bacterium]